LSIGLSYPHVETVPGQPARLSRLPRIRVAQIAMDYLAHGWSADEICRQHRPLAPAEVHAALAYYFDHQAEIDDQIRAEWEQVRQDRANAAPSPFLLRMRAKGLL
jgi:uncharacterized protein (DUF433 family)